MIEPVNKMRIRLPYVWQLPWKYVHADWATLDQMFEWASQNIGLHEFAYHDMQFLFKNEEDLVMFVLRWK